AVISASRFNPAISRFYRRLIEAGKKPKVALTACMRKLLCTLNVIMKNRTPWQDGYIMSQVALD
ncbi:MAG: IS110 family transposase, partial [Nitrospiraceae bacterium]|nr:IS110 family transposase [Nitrospiraceae bacterium]